MAGLPGPQGVQGEIGPPGFGLVGPPGEGCMAKIYCDPRFLKIDL